MFNEQLMNFWIIVKCFEAIFRIWGFKACGKLVFGVLNFGFLAFGVLNFGFLAFGALNLGKITFDMFWSQYFVL